MRETYVNFIKTLDITLTDFLDIAVGDKIKTYGQEDEYFLKEIQKKQSEIDALKTLLKENEEKRKQRFLKDTKTEVEYNEFCEYLTEQDERYNTKRVNERFGVNLKDYGHFCNLQERYKDKKFCIEDFKELKE